MNERVFRPESTALLVTLFALNFFDEFGQGALTVLGPDIQNSLGLSDTVLTVLAALSGALVLAGSVPAAVLADRIDRPRVIGVTSVLLAAFTLFTGFAHATWQLVLARFGAGINKGNLPAFNSLVADAVPIEARARGFAFLNGSNSLAFVLTPITVGAIASLAGGDEGWRWAFILVAAPVLVLGVVVWSLRDPGRGHYERAEALGVDVAADDDDAPAPLLDEAFARLKRIKTFYFVILAMSVVGVGLFVIPTLVNLHLEARFGLSAGERGIIGSITGIGSVVGTVLAGATGDRLYRRDPAQVLRWCAFLLLGMLCHVVAMQASSEVVFVVFRILGDIPVFAVFTLFIVITAPIVPPRMRSMGFALVVLYVAVGGGLGGSIIGGALSDSYGEAAAVTIILGVTVPVAALLLLHASRFVNADIDAVARDLREEEDQRRWRSTHAEGPLPAEALLDVRRLDFSYGSLQVLFGVDLEVRQGEVLALLGTNGAGKSTLLRAVTGLGFPDGGVVWFAGEDITYKEPAGRVRLGIVQVPGGRAVFPSLSVEENLRLGGFTLPEDVYAERRDRVLELFPALPPRLDQPAGTMSGGERQMLALAKGMLLDPRLLCIDELSLGLAPVVVQQLIEVVAALKEQGVTMLIVEQSVNVALTLADRALFMEKGHVRFEGPAAELLERDDLARAVFLGGEGG